MSDLIERLEAATEGSADLDFAIAELVGTLDMPVPEVRGAPHYTTSIDAALTLVPEGWRVESLFQSVNGEWWDCILHKMDGGYLSSLSVTTENDGGTTPALALCIAGIRARQSETPQGSE